MNKTPQRLSSRLKKESWTIDEYAQHIEPRLRKLADEEPPPKVMPVVLAEWDLV